MPRARRGPERGRMVVVERADATLLGAAFTLRVVILMPLGESETSMACRVGGRLVQVSPSGRLR